ncbi:MAG: hypothetical protein KJ709_09600 [Nanoarchaeota archaeon]|nr:hypothetical protein [Nanoarchaeota archaeon]
MRIEFKRTIKGEGDLAGYLEEKEPFLDSKREAKLGYGFDDFAYLITFKYYLNRLKGDIVAELTQRYGELEMDTRQTSGDTFWVEGYYPFSMTIDVILTTKVLSEIPKERWMLAYHKKERIDLTVLKQKIPVYKEIPSVDVSGEIAYRDVLTADPKPVLDILGQLGYSATVVPPSKDLERTIEILQQHGLAPKDL